jgi:hypothetical protein
MKRVLIVSPNWPPVTYPDMQRVRMACAHFHEFGWEPLVLTVDPDEQIGPKDPLLVETLPDDLKVWRACALPVSLTSLIGVKNVGLRSYLQIARLGDRVIATERPSVVFFSTTMFALFSLGRRWRARFGVPYVLDYQDPWVSEKALPSLSSLGGIKRRLVDRFARAREPAIVRGAAHIVSVSPAYPAALRARYPEVAATRFTVLPFAASEADAALAARVGGTQPIYDPNDGYDHWVYAGVGVAEMTLAARAFFLALAQARVDDPDRINRVRVHLVGTAYAGNGRRTFTPIAAECGVGDLVSEHPERITYFESLRCLQQAAALLVFGSDDPGYTASKIYPNVLARKPLLVICHEQSTLVQVVNGTRCGTLVQFASGEPAPAIAERVVRDWFAGGAWSAPDTDWSQFESYSARSMTKTLCDVFQQSC